MDGIGEGGALGGAPIDSAAKAAIKAQVQAAQRGGTKNAEAHEQYLQGRYFQSRDLMADLARPVEHFQRAVELDPQFALGWAALSLAYSTQANLALTVAEITEGFAQARRAADRALILEPNLAEAFDARMLIQLNHDFDWQGARKSLQQARTLAPPNPTTLVYAFELDDIFGQTDKKKNLELIRQALALDPFNVSLRNLLAGCLQANGRFDEAEAEMKRLISLSPNGSHGTLGALYLERQRFPEAVAEAEREPVEWIRLFTLAEAYWAQKNSAASDAALRKLIETYPEQCGLQIAFVYGFRGELDQAFAWLERAYRQRDTGLPGIKGIQNESAQRRLCADPRWQIFLRKLGQADEQLK